MCVSEKAQIDLWLKSVAPSNELRKWFGHDPDRFAEFSERYRAELTASGYSDLFEAFVGNGNISEITRFLGTHPMRSIVEG